MSPRPKPAPRPLDDAEPTTNLMLESGNRLKASRPMVEPPPAEDAPSASPARAGSESRLALHSSLPAPSDSEPASPEAPIRVGQQSARIGPYQIVCELAAGGMASVFLTLHRSVEGFQKLCAVKRIHPHLASDRAFTEMFVDEAQIAARISHPYVCSVFSFGRSRDSHFIAMEFLRGEPLSAVYRRIGRSPELGDDARFPLLAARVLANLAEGLHAAHTLRDDQGALLDVVHRDVTPQNLFVMYDGSVRVTDFGIAQARQRLHHTRGQKLKGKLSYIAPELLNRGAANAQVDVWGLGVVLWELLTGRRLFLGSSEGETLASVMSRVVEAPSEFRSGVPVELDRIVLRALERDVQHRYRSARDMARDLERFLKDCGDSVPAMDVADWMGRVFPDGAARIQGLVELAAHVSAATAEDTVVRVPSSPPATSGRGSLASLPTLPVATTVYDLSAQTKAEQSASVEASPATLQASLENSGHVPYATRLEPPAPARPPTADRRRWVVAALTALAVLVIRAVAPNDLGVERTAPTPVLRPAAVSVAAAPTRAGVSVATAEISAEDDVIAVDALPVLASPPKAASAPVRPTASLPRAATTATARNEGAAPTPAPKQGDVYVTTPGAAADVLVEGRSLGRAPGKFRLGVGRHELLVRGDNGVQRLVSVAVAAESPTLVTVRLAP